MVSLVNNNEFPKETVVSSLFLTSLRDFEKEGVELGVEKVSKLFRSKAETNKNSAKLAVQLSILGDFPKCRVWVVDEDTNEYVTEINDKTGDEDRIIDFEDVSGETVTFYYRVRLLDKDADLEDGETEIRINQMSSAYPLFKAGFVENGLLPAEGKGDIDCTYDELKQVLEGMVFTGKYEHIKNKYAYDRLDVVL